VQVVKEAGARRVFAVATHGVLSPPAVQRINGSIIEEVRLRSRCGQPGC
jgi:ribose-phosphate pyrophosphokinase